MLAAHAPGLRGATGAGTGEGTPYLILDGTIVDADRCREKTQGEDDRRPLAVVLGVRDFLALFEHVFFGLVVGNICWRRGLLAILGVMAGVLVVGVLVLGVTAGAGCHGCESCLQVPGTQTRSPPVPDG